MYIEVSTPLPLNNTAPSFFPSPPPPLNLELPKCLPPFSGNSSHILVFHECPPTLKKQIFQWTPKINISDFWSFLMQKHEPPIPFLQGGKGGWAPTKFWEGGGGWQYLNTLRDVPGKECPVTPHLKRVPCNPPSKKSALQPPFKNSALQPPWKFGRGLMRNLLNGYIKLKIFANNYIVVWQSSKCTSGILWKWILCTCFLASFDDHLLVPCFLMI